MQTKLGALLVAGTRVLGFLTQVAPFLWYVPSKLYAIVFHHSGARPLGEGGWREEVGVVADG